MVTVTQSIKKSDSLQALRGIAFLGIFFIHSSFVVNWAGIGVSLFFVLSGFLTERKYGNSFDEIDLKRCFLFLKSRIGRAYVLHIIIMLLWSVWTLIGDHSVHSIITLLAKIILNITLTQSWVPDSTINVCLNGVAWFLSSISFHYFIFPVVDKRTRKMRKESMLVILILLLTMQVLSCWVLKKFFVISPNTYSWFMYTSPVFRFVDFFAGMCLSRFVSETEVSEVKTINRSLVELAALIATVLLYSLINNSKPDILLIKALYNGTTVYILPSMIWIKLFFDKKGIITRFLSCKPLVSLGNISGVLFLVHYLFTSLARCYITFTDNIYIITFIDFVLSVVFSLLYIRIEPFIWKEISSNNDQVD